MRVSVSILLVAACLGARADVYLLADGSRVEGVSDEHGDSVTISTFDGKTIKVAKKDIRGNIPEPKRNEYFKRLKGLKKDDAAGRVELGLFCQKNKLPNEAQELFEAALKIDPANADAGKALGYILTDGKWKPGVDASMTIGLRPVLKTPEASRDQVQAFQKRLEKIVVNGLDPNRPPEVTELIADARTSPTSVTKLMLPPQFQGALSGIKPEVRTRAAWLAGLTQDRRFMQALIDQSIYDPEETVRFAAAKALPMLEEPVALRKLMDIATTGDSLHYPWPVRRSASIALRRYGSQEIIERMMRELSFELAGGNARDPKNHLRGKGTGVASDNPLGVQDTAAEYGVPETELYPVLSAMKEITGKTFDAGDKDMKTWIGWWKTDGTKFVFKD